MRKTFLILILFIKSNLISGQIPTIGPMLHLNFSADKPKITFGIEVALYFDYIPIPYLQSVDLGFEVGKGINIIYSEIQITKAAKNFDNFTGISAGIFRKKESDSLRVIGFQSTLWTAYIAGADIRFRLSEHYKDFGIGLFGKMPIFFGKIGT